MYFSEVLASALHKVIQSSSSVRHLLFDTRVSDMRGLRPSRSSKSVKLLDNVGRVKYVLSSRPARRIHPIVLAMQRIVPRAYLSSTLQDALILSLRVVC